MSEVSVAEAKTHLTRLLQKVESGEKVRITRRGKPVAVLVSHDEYERRRKKRQSFSDFVAQWRKEIREGGFELFESESAGLREDRDEQSPPADFVVKRFGNGVLLLPRHSPWAIMREALDEFEPGLKLEREQPPQQERAPWVR